MSIEAIKENDLDREASHDRPLAEDIAGAAIYAARYAQEAILILEGGYSLEQCEAALVKLKRAVFLLKAAVSAANDLPSS